MKKLTILLITAYQIAISPLITQLVGQKTICRFDPTCSEYTKTKIEEYGMIRGIFLGLGQFMRCHPFARTYGNL